VSFYLPRLLRFSAFCLPYDFILNAFIFFVNNFFEKYFIFFIKTTLFSRAVLSEVFSG